MSKINEFQKILKKKKVDFALFVNMDYERINYDMVYFSRYCGVGVLIIPKNKPPFLIVSKMESKRAGEGGLKVYYPDKKKRLSDFTKEIIKRKKIRTKKVGINKEEFTLLLKDIFKKSLKISGFVDLRKELYKIREQKTKKEINTIKKGCRISGKILSKCFMQFRKFIVESDVAAFLEYEAKKLGCSLAFPTIVASGKNAVKAHHEPEKTKLKKGFCVIDFGIRYKNYCTDTTRTIYIGKPSKKETELYNLLLNTQKDIIKKIKLNKKCSELFKEVKNKLGKYSKYFTHGLGHGLGVKIHELPNLTEKSKDKIKENTIFTIEPGLYLKNLGIRIEDDILVTKKRTEILTKTPKHLLTIDFKK